MSDKKAASDVHNEGAADASDVTKKADPPKDGPTVTLRRPANVGSSTDIRFAYNFVPYVFPYDQPIPRPSDDVLAHLRSMSVVVEE